MQAKFGNKEEKDLASTFFGLNIAYTGLQAANTNVNTTGNNISNVHTEGYSRQQVDQKAANAMRTYQSAGCAGSGVVTTSIDRIREGFYDEKYRENQAYLGEYKTKAYYMKTIESFFDETTNSAGFTNIFDSLISTSLQEVLKNPSSESAKRQFIGDASSLADYFNSVAGRLQNTQADLNSELKLTVDTINSYASQIATLNHQINVVAVQGGNQNELMDERDVLVDKLSELIDVETQEIEVGSGVTRYIIRVAGGITLVDNGETNNLSCKSRELNEKVNQSDIDGLYDIYWSDNSKFNLYSGSIGGKLEALIHLRDGNNKENFSGKILEAKQGADGKDYAVIEVDNENIKDFNKCNLPEQGIINLGNQNFYYDSWEYTINYDADGKEESATYKFILSDELNDSKITSSKVGKNAAVGGSLGYMGIPYYMSQMNEWVRTFSQKANDILKDGYTSDGRDGCKLFSGNLKTDRGQYEMPDSAAYYNGTANASSSVTVKSTDDSYYRLTAFNLQISDELDRDPTRLATKSDSAGGVEQGDLLRDLYNMATNREIMSFRGTSAHEFLECVLADTALNTSTAESFEGTYDALERSINNQRTSISGVDEDEEAVNLVKFQNAYNLASKVISILAEMYDRLILQTGV